MPQSPGGTGAGMNPMPASGVPGSPPTDASAGAFDPASIGQTNANTLPEGVQADMTGRMLNSAMLVASANPDLDDETCATLAVIAHRSVAANPLDFGRRGDTPDGPITQQLKKQIKRHLFPDRGLPLVGRPPAGLDPTRQPVRPGRGAPMPGHGAPTPGHGAPSAGGHGRPHAPAGRQWNPRGTNLLDVLPLKPHERRLVDSVRGLIKRHRDRGNNPHPGAPPIPAPPWVQDPDRDEEDIEQPPVPVPPAAPGALPPGVRPHDLNEDDSESEGESEGTGKAAVLHVAENPLDFGNRAPTPEGPLEQKAVDTINQAEDAVPMPGDTPKIPGMGGGKPGGGKAPGAGAAGEAGAGEAGAAAGGLGEVAELAPMLAV